MRDNVDRTGRWDCVGTVWNWLAQMQTIKCEMVADRPVAWVTPGKTLDLQLQALINMDAIEELDFYRSGELWVRIGIDGVPWWHSHVVAITLSICGKLKIFPEHSGAAPSRGWVAGRLWKLPPHPWLAGWLAG